MRRIQNNNTTRAPFQNCEEPSLHDTKRASARSGKFSVNSIRKNATKNRENPILKYTEYYVEKLSGEDADKYRDRCAKILEKLQKSDSVQRALARHRQDHYFCSRTSKTLSSLVAAAGLGGTVASAVLFPPALLLFVPLRIPAMGLTTACFDDVSTAKVIKHEALSRALAQVNNNPTKDEVPSALVS